MIEEGTTGYLVKTYKSKYNKATGVLISKDFVANSRYKTVNKVVARVEAEPTTEPTTVPTTPSTEPATEPTPPTVAPTAPSTEPPTTSTPEPSGESGGE